MNRYSSTSRVSAILLASVLTTIAQDRNPQESDIVDLSPFEVSAGDTYGYLATMATSGTRLAVSIRDLPVALDVITADFMEDIGATDMESALSYTSGVFFNVFETAGSQMTTDRGRVFERSGSAQSAGGAAFNNSAFIRGFRVDTQTREGFRLGGSIPSQGITLGGITDTVMMERIEVVRGPAALLYGVGVLSGVVNVIGKRPMPQESYEVGFRVGSHDYFRSYASATGPLAWGINYRLGGSYQERENWTQYWSDQRKVYFGQLEKRDFFDGKLRVFLEASKASQTSRGIGFMGLRDTLENAYNQGAHIPHRERFLDRWDDPIDWVRDPAFGDQPDSYRMSGPDSFRDREEWNMIADLEFEPLRGLVFKLGTYIADQEMETFTPRARTFNNNVYGQPSFGLFDSNFMDPANVFVLENPRSPLMDTLAVAGGIGAVAYGNRMPDGTLLDDNDYKSVGYFWTRNPVSTFSRQFRLEGTYHRTTRFFGGEAKHTLLAGYHHIDDTVTYLTGQRGGNVTGLELLLDRSDDQSLAFPNFADHPFRHPTDITPLRYQGEAVTLISRHENETDVSTKGAYFVYMGQFFDEKLMMIAGIRRDSYNVRESIYRMDYFDFRDYNNPVVGKANRHEFAGTGERLGFLMFDDPVTNERVPYERRPQFDRNIVEYTPTVAASYRLTDQFSVFATTSGGILPNTGWVDGNNDAIPPEVTRNYEVGIKFELGDRLLSGSVSVFRIDRRNGVMRFDNAPTPRTWAGNDEGFEGIPDFRPQGVIDGDYPITIGVRADYLPWDSYQLVVERGEDGLPIRDEQGRIVRSYYPGVVGQGFIWVAVDVTDIENMHPDVLKGLKAAFNESRWMNGEVGEYFEEMVAKGTISGQVLNRAPINYTFLPANPGLMENPSTRTDTNVRFEDESTGLDLNFILSPLRKQNFQLIFNYSYVRRKITGMTFVDPVHKPSGQRFFTPWDSWAWFLGQDAFAEDGDPLTFNGAGVYGKSFYFAPEHSANTWIRYTFDEGMFENLTLAGGVSYTGPAATSVIIGNPELDVNRFLTPRTAARYTADAAITYLRKFDRVDMRLALNVFNVFNHRRSFAEVAYPDTDIDGVPFTRYRRTENHFGGRSFHLSVTFLF